MTTIYSKSGTDAAISAATGALTPEDVGADPAGTAAAAIAALGLGTAAAADTADFATAAQGAKADGASQPGHTHPDGSATTFFGSDAATPRPANPNPVIWIGHTGVTPTHAITDFDMVMTFDAPVTTFADSFADGAGTLPPAGWTNVGWNTSACASWNESAGYFTIVKGAAAAWATKIDAFTIDGDVDVVAKMSTDTRVAGNYHCGIIIGGSGSEAARVGTVAYLRKEGYVFLSEYLNNVIQTGSEVLAPAWDAANTIVYMRLRVSGTTASVKVWKEAAAEPSEWLTTYTVTAKAGWIGIFSAGDMASKIYYFAASKTGTAALE